MSLQIVLLFGLSNLLVTDSLKFKVIYLFSLTFYYKDLKVHLLRHFWSLNRPQETEYFASQFDFGNQCSKKAPNFEKTRSI